MSNSSYKAPLGVRVGYDRPRICVMRYDLPEYSIPSSALPLPQLTTIRSVLAVADPSVRHVIMNYLVDHVRLSAFRAVRGNNASV